MSNSSTPAAKSKSNRLAYLDWARGAAALVMLQGHVFHSFIRPDLRQDSPYVLSQFVGGMTPAVFLFLTGVTLAFLMDSRGRAGLSPAARVWEAFKRSRYLILLAIAFRVQLWVFAAGGSHWTDLFRVDILNSMGLAIALMAPLAMFSTHDRMRLGFVTGLAIACVSPIISGLNLQWVHPFIRAYFVPDANFFSFFPWGAFVAFGVSAGSVIRVVKEEDMMKVMQWASLVGIAMIVGARYFANLPYSLYGNADFWLNSPALILIKLGVMYLLLAFAFLWTRYVNPAGWSFIRQIGTTSLLVYWVHTEIVYGRWMWFWKGSLTPAPTFVIAVVVIAAMVGLSVARTGWKQWPGFPALAKARWDRLRAEPMQASAGD
jgi:uncharacterized membrane protein